MCPSGSTCLPANCYFSELALLKKIQLSMLVWYKVDLIIISLKINLFSPWYSWKIDELALNNNHSLTLKSCETCLVFMSVDNHKWGDPSFLFHFHWNTDVDIFIIFFNEFSLNILAKTVIFNDWLMLLQF